MNPMKQRPCNEYEYADCPFFVEIVAPWTKKRKRHRPNTQKGYYIQRSPFTPHGKFKSCHSLDVLYSVSPPKPWSAMTCCQTVDSNNTIYYRGDFVYVANDRSIGREDAANKDSERLRELHWIAKILEIRASDDDQFYALVCWMYFPDDLPQEIVDGEKFISGRVPYYGQNELIASNHNVINAISLVGHATVYSWAESEDSGIQNKLHWRQAYNCKTRELSSVFFTRGWQTLKFSSTGRNRVTVAEPDLSGLNEGGWLNDNTIHHYISHLIEINKTERPKLLQRIYFFETFFFSTVSSSGHGINYDGVKKWTKKVDLLSYDYIFIPIIENKHWYLAIICNIPNAIQNSPDDYKERESSVSLIQSPIAVGPVEATNSPRMVMGEREGMDVLVGDVTQPTIITFDSFGGSHAQTCDTLRAYLAKEAKEKRGVDLIAAPTDMVATGIPKQQDSYNCGIFVLGYIEKFLEDPDEAVRKIIRKEELGWDIRPNELRNHIRKVLKNK